MDAATLNDALIFAPDYSNAGERSYTYQNDLFELFYDGAVRIDEFRERKAAIKQELLLTGSRADDRRLKEEDLEGLLAFAESMLLAPPVSGWAARLTKNSGCNRFCSLTDGNSQMVFIEPPQPACYSAFCKQSR
jgi:hypothetical protein